MAVVATAAARQPHQPRHAYRRGASLMMPDDAIATPIWPDPAVTGSHRVTAPVPRTKMCGTGLTLRRSSNCRRQPTVSIRIFAEEQYPTP
jgi:hypothetical protein